jgi:hypothetical protein
MARKVIEALDTLRKGDKIPITFDINYNGHSSG